LKAFYGNRISEHMTKTPEGFLICHSVPIARVGAQEYLPRELGLSGSEPITVLRAEEDVFSPGTIASFEGKPVTDDHPPIFLDPTNYSSYMRGVVQNVRRGSGELSDYIVADMIIHDARVIAEIEGGKREISCGYDCTYVDNGDGTYRQVDMIGNHVAIVDTGRAGPSVAIQDSKPKGVKRMNRKENIWKRMFASFVKDAEPDEIQEAAQAVNDVECEGGSAPKTQVHDEGPTLESLAAAITALSAKVDALVSAEQKEPEHKDDEIGALDELEKELVAQANVEDEDESSVTISPESIARDAELEDKPEEALPTTDTAVTLAAIRAIKPVVAALPCAERKRAVDALNKAVRDAINAKSAKQSASYAQLTKRKVSDARMIEKGQFGENCRKRNPHYSQHKGGN